LEKLTELPFGLPGAIYRSPMPYSPIFDPGQVVMSGYQKAGVQVVVVLASWDEIRDLTDRDLLAEYQEAGLNVIYAPATDFGVPNEDVLREAVTGALRAARAGKTVAAHCHAGLGRTGIFAACLAKIVFGFNGLEAFSWVRKAIPGAVETQQQLQFIEDFSYIED
jgi:protein-tyrosine phosphatase